MRGFPKRDSLSFSDPLDQFYEPEALLAYPDEPLILDVELGEHHEREKRERHEGVVEAAAGPDERLASFPTIARSWRDSPSECRVLRTIASSEDPAEVRLLFRRPCWLCP